MKIEKLKTSKLFYNKWPYKVVCRIPKISSAISHRNQKSYSPWNYRSPHPPLYHPDLVKSIDSFKKAVAPLLTKDLRYRVEGDLFSIFCSDKKLLAQINKKLKRWIKIIYGPSSDEELEYLINNGHKKRVCDKLPKDIYQYRVYFKNSMPDDLKENFLNWSLNYKNKLALSNTTKNWMKGEHRYFQGPFMYVKDSSTLSMIGLFLAKNIKLVEEFVLRESINTPSE